MRPMRWQDGRLMVLDQTRLPAEEVWLTCSTAREVAEAIERLAVRGAPAIGLAAAYGVALGVLPGRDIDGVIERLAATRPTAVDLHHALERCRSAHAGGGADAVLEMAHALAQERIEQDRAIGETGAELFEAGDRALTHCNTGALATGGHGTAGGVLAFAHRAGRLEHVWVGETRPLLQGARLTAWELDRAGIPFRVVADSAAGSLMARGLVDRIVVGADRIAANGDVANKVGTYALAVLAERHAIPFYVAAPWSTVDPDSRSGADIPIEERGADEVTHFQGRRSTPAGAAAANPAFDVTPAALVTAYVTERGSAPSVEV